MRVGRRLEVKPCEHDKRQLRYKPTPHALAETQALIASMARPIRRWRHRCHRGAAGGARLSAHLFAAYGQLMLKEIYLIDLVQQSGLFISKDAGHMVLLMLHIESIRQNSPFLLLSSAKIAKSCSVSRAHVNRILQAAEKSGLLTTTNNVVIELNSSFFIMAERYFSLYFAMVEFGLERVLQTQRAAEHR